MSPQGQQAKDAGKYEWDQEASMSRNQIRRALRRFGGMRAVEAG